MGLKYVCDICEKEVGKFIRVDMTRNMYCEKCWMDKKNWNKIHKDVLKNSRF